MTAVSTLRDILTVIVHPHFPNIISAILYFRKLLPESPRIHADSRNSKNIKHFVNTFDNLAST